MFTLVPICVCVMRVAVPMEARGTGSSGVGVPSGCEPVLTTVVPRTERS